MGCRKTLPQLRVAGNGSRNGRGKKKEEIAAKRRVVINRKKRIICSKTEKASKEKRLQEYILLRAINHSVGLDGFKAP